ncbi:aminoglycoside phosphotransferase family protein [Natronoglycomyces albus]|uniref:Phosphotransferase n=1 Tax=Natronoglycomyces albus TaxID=2811108 RepID=A0A895XND8_9ACTN|nr:aminoglycoside phosphotransferase family protein [Natronoglycomyces albus]QSB04899.1 phosphotransferase [Natronoglycomyces albus]
MITAEELVKQGSALHDRFGTERADAFGQALPALVDDLTRGWRVQIESLYSSGATSIALAVSSQEHGLAVLKLSPDTEFLARQVTMLRHLADTGRVPQIFAHDPSAGGVLMERIIPGDEVGSTQPRPTLEDWASLLRDLHGAPTAGVTDTLRARCEDMIERISDRQRKPSVRDHVPDKLWNRIVEACRELLRTDREKVVIHGDLHLGNVLHGGKRGLVAIDPKMCVGDRCFDMVDFVAAEGGPTEMTARAHRLAQLTEIDPARLLRWSHVNAVVTAISSLTWRAPSRRTEDLLAFARAGLAD